MATTCFGGDVTFTPTTTVDNSTITFDDGGLESYDYYVNGTLVASGVTSDTYTISGLANSDVVYVVAHANGCYSDNSNEITVQTLPEFQPTISANTAYICADSEFEIYIYSGSNSHLIENVEIVSATTNATVATQGIVSGLQTTNVTVKVTLSNAQESNVLYAIVTTTNGCKAEARSVTLTRSNLAVTIAVDEKDLCEGETVTVTASATGADNISYEFEILEENNETVNGGTVGTSDNVYVFTGDPGKYTVTVTAMDKDVNVSECTATATTSFEVHALPVWGDDAQGNIVIAKGVDEGNNKVSMCYNEQIDLQVTTAQNHILKIYYDGSEDPIYNSSVSNSVSDDVTGVSVTKSGQVYTVTFKFDYDETHTVYFTLVDYNTACESLVSDTYTLVAHDKIVVKNADGAVYNQDQNGNVNITLCENTETTVSVSSGDNTSYSIEKTDDNAPDVTKNTDGSYTFTAGKDGDTFTYIITGSQTGCTTTIVTTTVAAPTAGNIKVTYYEEASGDSEQLDEFEELPKIDDVSYICEGIQGQITASGASRYTLTVTRDGENVTSQFTSSWGKGASVVDFSQEFALEYVECNKDYNEYVFNYVYSIGDCSIDDSYTLRVYKNPSATMTMTNSTGTELEDGETVISGTVVDVSISDYDNDVISAEFYLDGVLISKAGALATNVEFKLEELEEEVSTHTIMVRLTNEHGCTFEIEKTLDVLLGLADPEFSVVEEQTYYCPDRQDGVTIRVEGPQKNVTYELRTVYGNGTCGGYTCDPQTYYGGASNIQWENVRVTGDADAIFKSEDFYIFAYYEGMKEEGTYSTYSITVTEVLVPENRVVEPCDAYRTSCQTDDIITVKESQDDGVYYELRYYKPGVNTETGDYETLRSLSGNGGDLQLFEVKYPDAMAGTYVVYAYRLFEGNHACPVKMECEYVIDVPEAEKFDVYNPGGNYGNYCVDDPDGVVISLDGSEVGTIYMLYKDGYPLGEAYVIDGTVIEGTGGEISFDPVFDDGVYTVVALIDYCPMDMNGSVTVKRYELPEDFEVTVPNYGYYCDGEDGITITVEGRQEGKVYTLYSEDGTAIYEYDTRTGEIRDPNTSTAEPEPDPEPDPTPTPGSGGPEDIDPDVYDNLVQPLEAEDIDDDAESPSVSNYLSDGTWIYFDHITEGTYYVVVSEPNVDGGCDLRLNDVKVDMIEKPRQVIMGITKDPDESTPDTRELTVCVDDYLNIQFWNTEVDVQYTLMFKQEGSSEFVQYGETKTAHGDSIFTFEWGNDVYPPATLSDAGTYTVRATRIVDVTDVNGDPVYEGDGETVLTASCDFWYNDPDALLDKSYVTLTVIERPNASGTLSVDEEVESEDPCYGVDIVVDGATPGFIYKLYRIDDDDPDGRSFIEEGGEFTAVGDASEDRFRDVRDRKGCYVVAVSNGVCEDEFEDPVCIESDKFVTTQKVTYDDSMCIGDEGGRVGLEGAEEGVTYILYDADGNELERHEATASEELGGFYFDYSLVETGTYHVDGVDLNDYGCASTMLPYIDFTVNRLPLSFNFTNTVYYCSSVDDNTGDSGSTGGGSTGGGSGTSEEPDEDPEDPENPETPEVNDPWPSHPGYSMNPEDENYNPDPGFGYGDSDEDIYQRDENGNIVYVEVEDGNGNIVKQPVLKETTSDEAGGTDGGDGNDDKVKLPLLQTEGPDVEYILYRKEGDDDNYILREVERVTPDPDGGETIYFYVDLEDAVYVVSARNTNTGCTSSMEGETTVIGSQGIATLSESPFTVTTCGADAVFSLSNEVEATELVNDATYYIVSSDYEGELDDQTPVVAQQKYAEGGEISLDITTGSGTYNIWASYDDYECAAIVGQLVVNQYDKFEITDNQTEVCGENVTITLENSQEGVTYVLEATTENGNIDGEATIEGLDGPISWSVYGEGEATFLLSIQGSEEQCNETIEITFHNPIEESGDEYSTTLCGGSTEFTLTEHLYDNATYYVMSVEDLPGIDKPMAQAVYVGSELTFTITKAGEYTIWASYENYNCLTQIGSLRVTEVFSSSLEKPDVLCETSEDKIVELMLPNTAVGETYVMRVVNGEGYIVDDNANKLTEVETVATSDTLYWNVTGEGVAHFRVSVGECDLSTIDVDFTKFATVDGWFEVYVDGALVGEYREDDDPVQVCENQTIMLYGHVTGVRVDEYDFYLNGKLIERKEEDIANPIYTVFGFGVDHTDVMHYTFGIDKTNGSCPIDTLAKVNFTFKDNGGMMNGLCAVQADTSYCAGDPGVKLYFENAQKGYIYELYRVYDADGNPVENGDVIGELVEIEEIPSYSKEDVKDLWFESWTSEVGAGTEYADAGTYVVNIRDLNGGCSSHSNFVTVVENELPGMGDADSYVYYIVRNWNEYADRWEMDEDTKSEDFGLVDSGQLCLENAQENVKYELYNIDKDAIVETYVNAGDTVKSTIYFGPVHQCPAVSKDEEDDCGSGEGQYTILATDLVTGCTNELGSVYFVEEPLEAYDVYLYLNKGENIASQQLVPGYGLKGNKKYIGWSTKVDVAWLPQTEVNDDGTLSVYDDGSDYDESSGYTRYAEKANIMFDLLEPTRVEVLPDTIWTSVETEGYKPMVIGTTKVCYQVQDSTRVEVPCDECEDCESESNNIYAYYKVEDKAVDVVDSTAIWGSYGFNEYDGVDIVKYPSTSKSGLFTYSKRPSFYGTETIKYRIYNSEHKDVRVSNSATITILCGNEAVGDSTSVFLIPNAFSPNGDGYNDVFKIILPYNYEENSESSLEVFNRWGTLVYKSSGNQYGKDCDWWDGTSSTSNMVSLGKELPSGTYFYVYKITFINSTNAQSITKKMHGYIELRR